MRTLLNPLYDQRTAAAKATRESCGIEWGFSLELYYPSTSEVHVVTILLQKSIDFTPLVWYITSMKKKEHLSVTLAKHGAYLQLQKLKKRPTVVPNKKRKASRKACRGQNNG